MFNNPVSRLLSGFAQAIIELVEDETTPVTTKTYNITPGHYTTINSNISNYTNNCVKSTVVNDNVGKTSDALDHYQSNIQNETKFPNMKQSNNDMRLLASQTQQQKNFHTLSSASSLLLLSTHPDSINTDTNLNSIYHSIISNSSSLSKDVISTNELDAGINEKIITDNLHEPENEDVDNGDHNKHSLHIDTDHNITQDKIYDPTDTDTDSCLTEPQISPNYYHTMDKRYSLDEYDLKRFDSSVLQSNEKQLNKEENENEYVNGNQNECMISLKNIYVKDNISGR